MQLSLEDLCKFLMLEGMQKPESAKQAVTLLGQLRLREMARLSYTKEDWFQKEKQRLEEMQLHLEVLPEQEVRSFFRSSTLNQKPPAESAPTRPESLVPALPVPARDTPELLTPPSKQAERDKSVPELLAPPVSEANHQKDAPELPGPPLKQPEHSEGGQDSSARSLKQVGLQTPASDLRNMALMAGTPDKETRSVEKNDLLALLEVRISDTIQKKGRKMQLSLEDLCKFLMLEGMQKPESAKQAVTLLGQLRLREMARLSYTKEDWFQKEKQRLEEMQLHLEALPEQEVRSFFRSSTLSLQPAPELLTPPLKRQRTAPHDGDGLRAVFDKIDGDGSQQITRIEFIKACRQDTSIKEFFGIKGDIQQENGGRDQFESIFQCMDKNQDKKISWEEFQKFCQNELPAWLAQS